MTEIELYWGRILSKTYQKYYFINKENGISQWGIPISKNFLHHWDTHVSSKLKPGCTYYRNKLNGVSQWEYPKDDDDESNKKIRGGYELTPKYEQYFSKNYNLKEPRALKWTNNSCYLDSALFAFFAGPKKFIEKMLTSNIENDRDKMIPNVCGEGKKDLFNRKNTQAELKKIGYSIMNKGPEIEYCTDFRKTLRECPDEENYHTSGIGDAGEFIIYLLSIFPVEKSVVKNVIYGTNIHDYFDPQFIPKEEIHQSVSFEEKDSIVHIIHNDQIVKIGNRNDIFISQFLKQEIDSGILSEDELFYANDKKAYSRIIQIITLESTPYLIFSLKRSSDEDLPIHENIVIPDKTIKIGNKTFFLSAAVIYTGKCHYVAVAKYNGVWWYYDDQNYKETKSLKSFKTFDDVVKESLINSGKISNPLTHGTQFYYTPEEE